jgi:hypothetical protein
MFVELIKIPSLDLLVDTQRGRWMKKQLHCFIRLGKSVCTTMAVASEQKI